MANLFITFLFRGRLRYYMYVSGRNTVTFSLRKSLLLRFLYGGPAPSGNLSLMAAGLKYRPERALRWTVFEGRFTPVQFRSLRLLHPPSPAPPSWSGTGGGGDCVWFVSTSPHAQSLPYGSGCRRGRHLFVNPPTSCPLPRLFFYRTQVDLAISTPRCSEFRKTVLVFVFGVF